MIINGSREFDGLRPIEVDVNKVRKLSNPNESIRDTVSRHIIKNYHIINSRDWMFADTNSNKVVLIFYPKITNAKVNKINADLGV